MVLAVKLNVCPAHTGELLVNDGAPGTLNTVTLNVPAGPVHPATVAFTEYIPVANVLAPGIVGF